MIFLEKAKTHPHDIALRDEIQTRTWLELNEQSLKLADYFCNEKGLKAEDHIALLVGNRLEFIEAIFASFLAGIWVTPINTHLVESEVAYIINNSEAKLVLFDQGHQHLLKLDDTSSAMASEINPNTDSNTYQSINIENLSRSLFNKTYIQGTFTETHTCGGTMLYTSGTTGLPKGVQLTNQGYVNAFNAFVDNED